MFLLMFLNSLKDFETQFHYYSSSLPVIMSLLGLWVVLFLFFAISYVEVFGLTKWGGVETRTTNYYSLGDALVMLAFQSTGFVK
jgi:voltage-dependent calcium channel